MILLRDINISLFTLITKFSAQKNCNPKTLFARFFLRYFPVKPEDTQIDSEQNLSKYIVSYIDFSHFGNIHFRLKHFRKTDSFGLGGAILSKA